MRRRLSQIFLFGLRALGESCFMIVIPRYVVCLIACAAFLFIYLFHEPVVADGLIDGGQLQRQGLTRPWFAQVQMDVGRDRVENVNFDGELLTIQTKRGVIQTIDGETGNTLWASNVDSPGLFTSSVGVGPGHAVLANGSHLLVLDRKTGKQVWSRKLSGGVIGAPGVSDDFVFVPKVDGNLEVYSLDKPRDWSEVRSVSDTQFPVWRFNSHGKTMVQPTIFDGIFGWSNDRATFYVARIKPMEILFRLETFEDVVVPPAKIGSFLYVVSASVSGASVSTLFKYYSISLAEVLKKGVQKTCFSAKNNWLSSWTSL